MPFKNKTVNKGYSQCYMLWLKGYSLCFCHWRSWNIFTPKDMYKNPGGVITRFDFNQLFSENGMNPCQLKTLHQASKPQVCVLLIGMP